METLERVNNTYTTKLPRVPRGVKVEDEISDIDWTLSPEERADWLASIEHDVKNPNRGITHRPIEELWRKLEDSVRKHYEGVSC